jgi:Domain of unknown function (DUF5916)
MKLLARTLFVCVLTAWPAFSQSPPVRDARESVNYETARLSKIATAVRITEPITLDGHLEEPAWALAIPATDFVQRTPHAGELSGERTEVRFLYDDTNLYVGFTFFDSDAAHMIVNQLQKDFDSQVTDSASVTIDSLHDRRSGFIFTTNPVGAKRDIQITGTGGTNIDWDGVWDVKVSRNDNGWISEYRIPFKTLRFSKAPVQEWGLNMTRRVFRLNEESQWAPVPPRYNAARTEFAGTLVGLENIHQGRNLKIKPYIAAGTTQIREGDQLRTVQRLDKLTKNPDAGYDGGYDGGVDLKYSLTPSLILDASYHTDFAQVEVDQQQVNLTRFNLFFPEKRDFFLENTGSFSFGPGGNLVPFFSRRIGLSAAGTPIPIVAGGRVSGQVNQYNLGFLAMKTERSGSTPSNNFVVGRVKRNLLTNSWVGTLFTNRDSSVSGDYNRVYGTDAHFEFYKKLQFDSYVLRSDTPGKTGSNQARRFETAWRSDEWVIVAEHNAVQSNFNPEVGFIRRRDMEQYSGDFAWKPILKNDTIHNLNFATSMDYFGGSSSGKVETRKRDVTAGIEFQSSGSASFTITSNFDRLANTLRIPSGNPHVSIPQGDYGYRQYAAQYESNPKKRLNANGTFTWGDFYGGRQKAFNGTARLKPNQHMNVSVNYDRNDVTLPNGSFTTNLIGTRFLYAFSPRAFFNAFIQYNADTHLVSSNIRFNFTHHPLSDIYLVYNDTRDTAAGHLVGRSFIIKCTNLFSF